MLLAGLLALWVWGMFSRYRGFFIFAFFAGLVLQVMAWIPLTAPVAYAVGWYNPNVVTARAVSVDWQSDFYNPVSDHSRVLTLEVTNNTSNFYKRIVFSCETPHGDIRIYDDSGIGANRQLEYRSYNIDEAVSSVSECNAERAVVGKPSRGYAASIDVREPWGDRLPYVAGETDYE